MHQVLLARRNLSGRHSAGMVESGAWPRGLSAIFHPIGFMSSPSKARHQFYCGNRKSMKKLTAGLSVIYPKQPFRCRPRREGHDTAYYLLQHPHCIWRPICRFPPAESGFLGFSHR